MKSIFLVRHAKSSWANSQLSDFERPLNTRGVESIPLMSALLSSKGEKISHFFSSSAARAQATARGLMSDLNSPASHLSLHKELYLADIRTMLRFVNSISDELNNVALVGHNPGLTDFCNYLSGSYIDNIPTCGICKITFETDHWNMVSGDLGKLEFFEFPKGQEND